MALALAHFAFGAAMTTIIVVLVVPNVRYPRTWVMVGGIWALLPDLHWVSPYFTEALHRFHRSSPLVDVFWLHRTLDTFDPGHRRRVAFYFLGFFFATTVVAEYCGYRRSDCVPWRKSGAATADPDARDRNSERVGDGDVADDRA